MAGRPSKSFSQREIQNAIDQTRSYCEAARYLRCSYNTFKKYTQLYGLWIVGGKNPYAKGIPKLHRTRKRNLDAVLDGTRNGKKLNLTKLRNWIIREIKLPEKCDMCGFDEKRVTDLKVPLVLCFRDGNRMNYKLENLQLKCWNCAFLSEGNIMGRKPEYFSNSVTGDVWKQIET